ncbi:hypothetical protein FRC98_06975 [Lujinxingia vulgaris]|uniref:Uncharacterized protein n=1 Tax=Lujinxingia vulgaris TaxID=2600176 RepID=A0A5C6XDS1_9DELT|nr:hypothetical protein [Lujinxingia vulgaris]TXD38618.1 hypothetical protein FRC98_06975 [Lujinxingia vulgaris]
MSTDSPPQASRIARYGLIIAAAALVFALLGSRDDTVALPQEVAQVVAEHPASIVLVTHHVAYRALREHPSFATRPVALLSSWPPSSLVVSYDEAPQRFEDADMKSVITQDDWVVWEPATLTTLPLFDLASVETIDAKNHVAPCPRDDAGFARCGEPDWMRPGLRDVEVDGTHTTCTWAHPLPDKRLRVSYPQVRPRDDKGRTLTLLTGLRDSSVGTGAPVEVSARLGDDVLNHTHRDSRGWQALPLPSANQDLPLTLEISSPNPGRRHFCYRFEYR